MTPIPEQGYTFFVSGLGPDTECWLPVDSETTLETIRDQMVEAGITAGGYGTILAKDGDGLIAQACLRGGVVKWEMLRRAIRAAERGTDIEAISAWIANTSDITFDPFFDEYAGFYESLADYAEDMAIAAGDVEQTPERLRDYIDWERIGKQMVSDGVIWTHADAEGTHVFRS